MQERVYQETGRLLNFVDGHEEERAIAINARTGDFLIDNFNRRGYSNRTGFNDEEVKEINRCKDMIIVIHNHSYNVRPSAADLLMYLHNEKLRISIVALHEGKVFAIKDVKKEFESRYMSILEMKKEKISDIDEAKRLATTEIYIYNDSLSDKKKLFVVEEL